MKLPDPPLLLITDRHQAVRLLAEIVEAALVAGCRWVSLREKDLPEDELRALALSIRAVTERYGARFSLHGTAELAARLGFDAVHLAAGGDVAAARRILGVASLIGVSVHTAGEAARLDPAHADYAVIGPAFPTRSKPGYGPALCEAGIAAAAGVCPVPLIAVGGIETANNVMSLRQAGAAGIAVMGGIMRAAQPGDAIGPLVTASVSAP